MASSAARRRVPRRRPLLPPLLLRPRITSLARLLRLSLLAISLSFFSTA